MTPANEPITSDKIILMPAVSVRIAALKKLQLNSGFTQTMEFRVYASLCVLLVTRPWSLISGCVQIVTVL